MLRARYETIKFDNDDLRKKDYLNNLIYATTLKNKIQEYFESENEKPLYIGLTGAWGAGKTKIAKTAINMISEKYDDNFKYFEFDAWKYEGDSFRRTFTNSILKQSGINKNTAEYKNFYNRLYNDKNVEIESFSERIKLSRITDTDFNKPKFWILLILVSAIVFFLSIKFPYHVAITVCVVVTIFNSFGGYKSLKANVSYSFDKLFSPEQFYNTVNEILSKVHQKYKLILIDNIDRCNNEDFVDTISSIKGFFNDEGCKIVYLIPFDINQFDLAFLNEHQGYSEKVFDTTIDIKEKSEKNTIAFIDKLLKDYPDYFPLFTDDVIGIIANSNCKTPRQILNLCNNYITEYNLFVIKNKVEPKEINVDDLGYLMKYTVLKIYHKELFDKIHFDSELIERLEKLARKRELFDSVIKLPYFKGWLTQKTYDYMLKNYAILPTDYSFFYENQNETSFSLGKEMEHAIIARDFEYILDNIQSSENALEEIVSYLKNSIIFDINKGYWKTKIAPKFELIMELLENDILSIENVEIYFNKLLKNDKLYPELIYAQIIDIDKILKFINKYISKYPRRNSFKNKLLVGLVNKSFKYEPINETVLNAKIFGEIEFESLTEEEKNYFEKYIEGILYNKEFKKLPYCKIFNTNNSKYISNAQFNTILSNTSYTDLDIINEVLYSAKNKILLDKNENLLTNYFSFINKISPYIKESNIFIKITEYILELKEIQTWNSKVSSLNMNITFEDKNEQLYKNIYDILKFANNTSLKNILLSLKTIENKSVIINLLKEKDFPPYLDEFNKSFVERLNDEEFKHFIEYPIELYNYSAEFEYWLNRHLFSNKNNIVLYFYDKLTNPDKRESIINYVLSQNLSFEQQIKFIGFYESDISRYQELINKNATILQLCKIGNNTEQKKYFEICMEKIIEIIYAKSNIIENEILAIEEILDNSYVTKSIHERIIIALGINKTTKEHLFKIYNKLPKRGRKLNEMEVIESYLIEMGLLEKEKDKTKESDVIKTKSK